MEYLFVAAVLIIAIVAIVFYTSMAIRYGGQKVKASAAEQKITDWRNLATIVSKKLEKYDRSNATLSYKISRAYTADELATLMHEVWDTGGGSDTDQGLSGETRIQVNPKGRVVPPGRK